jgi:serine palmitoyltransferase
VVRPSPSRAPFSHPLPLRPQGYAPLLQDWENFYTRRLYHRIQDCWNRPIAGPAFSSKLHVVTRSSTDQNHTLHVTRSNSPSNTTDEDGVIFKQCINLGSYNYLGFSDDWHATCRPDVMAAFEAQPIAHCTSFADGGYSSLHRQLEKSVAEFIGKEDACVFNMGWATNFMGIPSVAGRGTLIISDSLNHNSIAAGCRTSGSTVRVFKHNDLEGLESLVRTSIVDGQDRTHRPWKKILIVIEGIYSMEGEFCDLAPVVAIAKKYKCYTYLDEAHSIGAMGRTGRGVCEHSGVDPRDVDILMGTFTKSFGAMGGYIAGTKEFIAHVRAHTAGFLLDNAMAPVVCQQVLTAFKVMRGLDGTDTGAKKVAALRDNSNYMRSKLSAMGLEVLGDRDSPIMPIMIYNPTKIAAFSRLALERGVRATVCACVRLHLSYPPPAHSTPAARRRRRGLPSDAPRHLTSAHLHQRGAHARGPQHRAREAGRDRGIAEAQVPPLALRLSRGAA